MIYTPKKIKRALKKCINEISLHPKQFANNPEKDFTRKRKLPLKQPAINLSSGYGEIFP